MFWYIFLTCIFIGTQFYMLKVIWQRGKESRMWKQSHEQAEWWEAMWHKKWNEATDDFLAVRQKFNTVLLSRHRIAKAIVDRRVLPSIKKEAQEIVAQ